MQIPKEEIRQSILHAAEEEILQEGYKKCSMRRIAARAGVSPGNIYAYFSGKEEILDCIVRPALDEIHQVMEMGFAVAGEPPGMALRKITRKLAQTFMSFRIPCLIMAYRSEGTAYENVIGELSCEIAGRVYTELLPSFPPEMQSRLLADMMGEAFLHGLLRMFRSAPADGEQLENALESFLELMCGMKVREE